MQVLNRSQEIQTDVQTVGETPHDSHEEMVTDNPLMLFYSQTKKLHLVTM